MIELLTGLIVVYVVTLFIVTCIIKNQESVATWKEAFFELDDVPVMFVPIVNTCALITYLAFEIIEKCKFDS